MALTWASLAAGAFLLLGLPTLVILLNRKRANAGWWLLGGFIAIVAVGNLLEKRVLDLSSLG